MNKNREQKRKEERGEPLKSKPLKASTHECTNREETIFGQRKEETTRLGDLIAARELEHWIETAAGRY